MAKQLDPLLRQSIKGGQLKKVHLGDIAEHFFRVAGGAPKVAKLLFDEFNGAAKGSLVRQRILDTILRATKFGNEVDGKRDDIGTMSDEDLEREFVEAVELIHDTANRERPCTAPEVEREAVPDACDPAAPDRVACDSGGGAAAGTSGGDYPAAGGAGAVRIEPSSPENEGAGGGAGETADRGAAAV